METLVPAIQLLLVSLGIPLAVKGLQIEWRGIRMPIREPGKVLTFFRGFRTSVIGLALIGVSAGWAFDQTWLLLLSIAIGIEETIESSIDIFALRNNATLRLGPRASFPRYGQDKVAPAPTEVSQP